MNSRLKDKIAIVTGAGSGIGRAIALAMVREGARVVLVGRRKDRVEAVAREVPREEQGSAMALAADVSKRDSIERVLQETAKAFGGINVLVNNAGILHPGTAEQITEAQWDETFNINVRGLWLLSRAVLPHLRKAGGGSIINVASVAGSIKGAPNRFVYGATKAAVIGLTKSVAADFITRGIRCNAICPGTVESPSLRQRIDAQAKANQQSLAEIEAAFVARQPMGRIGTAAEIAALAVYLASDESAFTTGTAQVIDGGWSM